MENSDDWDNDLFRILVIDNSKNTTLIKGIMENSDDFIMQNQNSLDREFC